MKFKIFLHTKDSNPELMLVKSTSLHEYNVLHLLFEKYYYFARYLEKCVLISE